MQAQTKQKGFHRECHKHNTAATGSLAAGSLTTC